MPLSRKPESCKAPKPSLEFLLELFDVRGWGPGPRQASDDVRFSFRLTSKSLGRRGFAMLMLGRVFIGAAAAFSAGAESFDIPRTFLLHISRNYGFGSVIFCIGFC